MKLADTALLERRQWIAQLAERRGCTLEHARAYEQSGRHWVRVLRWIGIGIVMTLLATWRGLP